MSARILRGHTSPALLNAMNSVVRAIEPARDVVGSDYGRAGSASEHCTMRDILMHTAIAYLGSNCRVRT
jgi:hypothetical protein